MISEPDQERTSKNQRNTGKAMPFEDIDAMGLRDFVLSERKDASLWLFMHIPKTAGSSFSLAMQEFMPPYENIEVDYTDDTRTHNEKINIATAQFIDNYREKQYRSASGHITFDLVRTITDSIPRTKVFTFLRDPVDRVISDYRYQRTPLHPPYERFREEFPTIESYIDYVPDQNKMARFVAGRRVDLNSDDLTKRLDNDFAFVGLLDMYPLSYNLLFNLFGIPGQFPEIHSRKTPDTPDTKVEITDEVMSMIKEKNKNDLDMYHHVKARLMTIRDFWKKSYA